jgi:hypothetical protein
MLQSTITSAKPTIGKKRQLLVPQTSNKRVSTEVGMVFANGHMLRKVAETPALRYLADQGWACTLVCA